MSSLNILLIYILLYANIYGVKVISDSINSKQELGNHGLRINLINDHLSAELLGIHSINTFLLFVFPGSKDQLIKGFQSMSILRVVD